MVFVVSAGVKFDAGKRQWSLLPWGALGLVVDVLGYGATKYGAWNWTKVENGRERYFDALCRHLAARRNGEVLDPETQLPHMAHVTCNALFLLSLDTGLDVGAWK